MRPEDVLSDLRKQPFQPIRLTLTDGRTYEIQHPELAMVGRSSMTIGLMRPQEAEPIYDRMVSVSPLHIMQVEPIVPAASS
jgi:hypothetical protein